MSALAACASNRCIRALMSGKIQERCKTCFFCMLFTSFFPKQFTVGVLNAVLSVSALAGMLCPPPQSWLALVSQLVSHLGWVLCPPPWSRLSLVSGLVSQLVSGLGCCVRVPGLVFSCLRSCLPTCLPSWLGCCVRLPGLVFLLSPVLSPNLSPVALVSQLVSHLGWDAVSASLVSSFSCLRSCLPTCLRSGMLRPCPWSRLLLSPVLSPNLSPILAGMLCPPPWSRLPLVSGLVSQLVSHLGWDAVSASLVSSFSCLRSCLPTCLRSGMLRPSPWPRLLLSPVLAPHLRPILAGMLCPPPWSCLPTCLRSGMLRPPPQSWFALVSDLVSQLVSHLGWDAVPTCLPS